MYRGLAFFGGDRYFVSCLVEELNGMNKFHPSLLGRFALPGSLWFRRPVASIVKSSCMETGLGFALC